MDSLEGINTPSDLMKIQTCKPLSTNEMVKQLCEPIYTESPAIGLQVVENIVGSLTSLHEMMIDEMTEEGEPQKAISYWIEDKIKLELVLAALQDIKL